MVSRGEQSTGYFQRRVVVSRKVSNYLTRGFVVFTRRTASRLEREEEHFVPFYMESHFQFKIRKCRGKMQLVQKIVRQTYK